MCIEKFVNVLKSFNILKSKSEPSQNNCRDKSINAAMGKGNNQNSNNNNCNNNNCNNNQSNSTNNKIEINNNYYYNYNMSNEQIEMLKEQSKQEQNNNQEKQQEEKIAKMQNDKTIQNTKKDNQANEINNSTKQLKSIHSLYNKYPILPKILLLQNGNITRYFNMIYDPYDFSTNDYKKNDYKKLDNYIKKLCTDLFNNNKSFFNEYHSGKYFSVNNEIFIKAWYSIYYYYILANKFALQHNNGGNGLQTAKERLIKSQIELEKYEIKIIMNFDDKDYISAHQQFIENNIECMLNNRYADDKLILSKLSDNISLVPYYAVLYYFLIPNSIQDAPISYIFMLYNKLYLDIFKIYFSGNIKSDTRINQYIVILNKLFDIIKQQNIEEIYKNQNPEFSIRLLYDYTKKRQDVLSKLGIKIDNTLAKAS